MRLPGKTLTSFANVVFILLENVRKHCGLTNDPVAVAATFAVSGDTLVLTLENSMAADVNVDHSCNELNGVWGSRRGPLSFESVPKEGKSGLQKIARILTVEIGAPPQMRFTVTDQRTFRATVTLNAELLLP